MSDPIKTSINYPTDLNDVLRYAIENKKTKGLTFKINSNLDCKDLVNFAPLGNGENLFFEGTLDGQGYTIENLVINTQKTYDLGLFSAINEEGEVRNVRLKSVTIEQNLTDLKGASETTKAGIIAATCDGTISGCSVSGEIILQEKTDSCEAGGLCGSMEYTTSTISNSWADVSISFKTGDAETEETGDDKSCVVGGIVGHTNGKISACHSRSDLFGPSDQIARYIAGGICGAADPCAQVTACYNIGYLHSRGEENDAIGGITGKSGNGAKFSKCLYLKGCILSNSFPKTAKASNTIGSEMNWEKLTASGTAVSELSDDFAYTPADDDYSYTPHLKIFMPEEKDTLDDAYLMALCTPVAVSFKQSVYPKTTNPVKVDCKLYNCSIKKVLLTAKKPDGSNETLEPEVSKYSFSRNLGNNMYISYDFELTLEGNNHSVTILDVDIEMESELESGFCPWTWQKGEFKMIEDNKKETLISIPHIEEPNVSIGKNKHKDVYDKSISGFTEVPKNTQKNSYEFCRHHWVGNGGGPVVYHADFSAKISGATHVKVTQKDDTSVIESDIQLSEQLTEVKIGTISRDGMPYTFDTLIFTATNDSGMVASVEWHKQEQIMPTKYSAAQSAKSIKAESDEQWEYPLMNLIWCMTNQCNLHCRHCAFRDMHATMTELSGSEIRSVVKDIIQLGVHEVTLSGGEILLSPHWYETAGTLSQAGVKVRLITNGTLIDHDCAVRIKEAGVMCVSVSIDDLGEQNDTIRGAGCYEKAVMGVKYLKEEDMPVSIITTVNALNLNRLDEMRSVFTALGADTWCLKPIYPAGEAARSPELWLDEKDINKVMEFCYSAMFAQGIPVVPAMTFEMHSEKGAAVQRFLYGETIPVEFYGSYAGIFTAQLHPNGSLVGICLCTPSDAASNVKERSLSEIWRDKSSFHALREFDASMLSGYCGVCDRRDTCKGGDLNARLALGGINAENKFCTYRNFKLYGITI